MRSQPSTQASGGSQRTAVCGIGASAGGIEAIQEFFAALPPDTGLAYVVIIHMAPNRESELPSILARRTSMPVVQVADHDVVPLEPDHVYVIAPGRRLEITDSSVGASTFDQPKGHRRAVDLFFRSLAASRGDGFAVVLSGSGSDGAEGAKAVKEAGGVVLVQDPAEAAYDGMPRAVIATGRADLVLPVREIAARLPALVDARRRLPAGLDERAASGSLPEAEEASLSTVLDLLWRRTGHDFSNYKRGTVLRRLARRMQLAQQLTVGDYAAFVREQPEELQRLFDDLLISVTTFFRDPDAWAALQTEVIARLVARSGPGEQIRAWVPGCATGEEAYSLGILFHEEFERQGVHRELIIFASDVDDTALATARLGSYPAAIDADIPEERLRRYFQPRDAYYQVVSDIRDHIVFASHSVLRDPPFSKLHLITCRNLLIYLDRDLQERLAGVFRYACRDDAYLFLGSSEMADEALFVPVDTRHRIFAARPTEQGRASLPEIFAQPRAPVHRRGRDTQPPPHTQASEVHMAALESAAPPSAVVDDKWNVVHLSPSASRFFLQGGGPPARRVTDLVRPELREELHALMHRALDTVEPQLSPFVRVVFDESPRRVAMFAQQRTPSDNARPYVLVTFLDAGAAASLPAVEEPPSGDLVRSLREDLHRAERRIETMRDEHHLANEDLRAANEELQSLNEEYRSTTEELETSREELQSINEELQTVNQELKTKLEEISQAHDDLANLMAATDVATLFLDRDLRIHRFTPKLAEFFNVRATDVGRPIGDLTHELDYDELEADAARVLRNLATVEREVSGAHGRSLIARLNPYQMTGDSQPGGVVVTFLDVTALKKAQAAVRDSERRLALELAVTTRIHAMAMSVATAPDMRAALDEVLSAAVRLLGADFGSVQLLDEASGELGIVAHRGLGSAYLNALENVGVDDPLACSRALTSAEPIVIEDVNEDPGYARYRDLAAETGYRAVVAMPLTAKGGRLLGVLSVHYRGVHHPTGREHDLGDLLARQAADLIAGRLQQDRLETLNQALSHRTTELESSERRLSEQAEVLLQQDRNKEEFLAALGHELRNPMAAIQNSLEIVSVADENSRFALGILRRQARHMVRLINDLLDITRINRGAMRLQRQVVDVVECVRVSIDGVRRQLAAKGLSLDVQLPPQAVNVEGDPERLAQVFDNILHNAIDYTDAGSIKVAVHRLDNEVSITVQDTGTGMSPEEASLVFAAYHRSDHGLRHSGLGLGLSLVKRLVEMHGGHISLRSDGPGRGTEVRLLLTLAPGRQRAPEPVQPKAPPPRRVLVVDDQPDNADMFAALLRTFGQHVAVAYSGAEALATARTFRPEFAFVDLSMPGMDGHEVASGLRREFPEDALTLIALTGHPREYVETPETMFQEHLLKPAAVEAVIRILAGPPAPA